MEDIMTVTSVTIHKHKTYWIKRYKCGHYYINQGVFNIALGHNKQFYRQWVRTTKEYAESLLLGFNNQVLKHFTMEG